MDLLLLVKNMDLRELRQDAHNFFEFPRLRFVDMIYVTCIGIYLYIYLYM